MISFLLSPLSLRDGKKRVGRVQERARGGSFLMHEREKVAWKKWRGCGCAPLLTTEVLFIAIEGEASERRRRRKKKRIKEKRR